MTCPKVVTCPRHKMLAGHELLHPELAKKIACDTCPDKSTSVQLSEHLATEDVRRMIDEFYTKHPLGDPVDMLVYFFEQGHDNGHTTAREGN